ncbi:hypothetical protein [Micromonospora aurantiaca (nom. illeg.)]|uniref:hypothetical protein n=1 Tax=Micromonospora aurantiaca (nom. illeg.) TaxID=47850 RepID=UPI0033C91FB1
MGISDERLMLALLLDQRNELLGVSQVGARWINRWQLKHDRMRYPGECAAR